ncbi:MAG: hypothetical protein WKF40_01990 [Thermoleophilaceae bacterium]
MARRTRPTDLGGMLDFLADFVVYGGFVVRRVDRRPRCARGVRGRCWPPTCCNNVALLQPRAA